MHGVRHRTGAPETAESNWSQILPDCECSSRLCTKEIGWSGQAPAGGTLFVDAAL